MSAACYANASIWSAPSYVGIYLHSRIFAPFIKEPDVLSTGTPIAHIALVDE